MDHHRLVVLQVVVETWRTASAIRRPGFMEEVLKELLTHFDDAINLESEEGLASIGCLIAGIAIQLQRQAGMTCLFTKVNVGEGRTEVVFEYVEERVGLLTAEIAIEVATALLDRRKYDISGSVGRIREVWEKVQPPQLTAYIVDEATKRGIPCIGLNGYHLVQLGHGVHQKKIQRSSTNLTSSIGVKTGGNKHLTKKILRSSGVPVPDGRLVPEIHDLEKAIKEIGFPIALKPLSANHGKGISLNITNLADAISAFRTAKLFSGPSGVIVEKFIQGGDYRLLTIGYRFVAAAKRTAAVVFGDGTSTIKDLVDRVNLDPRRGTGHNKPLTFITIDEITLQILRRKGLTPGSILPPGESLFLKDTANLSTGGTSADVTDLVHPDNILLMERVAKIIDLDICGIDIISPDISVPLLRNGGVVIEVNSGPGFRIHMDPYEGKPRNVAGSAIDWLFPGGSPSGIPIIAVTGTRSSRFSAILVAQMIATMGYKVGCAAATGAYIQGVMVVQGNCTAYEHAEMIFRDPTVDFAVIECAEAGIFQTGLAFHNCDVGIVIDPEPGERATQAASVVARATAPTGHVILNADSETAYQMRRDLRSKVAYFSVDARSPRIMDHVKEGGYAAVVEGQDIVLYRGAERTTMINGVKNNHPMIQTALASVLLAAIYNIPVDVVRNLVGTSEIFQSV